jgi:hypothetical protein
MPHSAKLSNGISRHRQSIFIRSDIEGENAAIRSILLATLLANSLLFESAIPYALRSIVKCPDTLIDVLAISKAVREWRALGNGRSYSRSEKVHAGEDGDSKECKSSSKGSVLRRVRFGMV